MAFGTPVVGTAGYSAASGTSVAPSYPTGVTSTDQLILFVGQKPTTANGGTVTTPTGWTLREELTAAGGYGTTIGADTGNTNLRIYTKNTVAGTETGTLTVTVGDNNVSWAFIVRVPTSGGAITYATSDGQDTTAGNVSTTLGATVPFQTGDIALWAMCIPTDVTTPAQFSAHTISATGITFGTPVEINEPDSGTGNDIGGYSAYANITAGSGTVAPTIGATVGGTNTNVRGPIALIGLREALVTRTGNLAATETGLDTSTVSGEVLIESSLSVSEVGIDSLSASGIVTDPALIATLSATETGLDSISTSGDVIIKGSIGASEVGNDTIAVVGDVIVKGSLSRTESADALSATGDVFVKGSSILTESGSDSLVANADIIVKASISVSESATDTLTANTKVLVSTSLSSLESSDSASFAGELGAAPTGGNLVAIENNDSYSATADVLIKGSTSSTEGASDSFIADTSLIVKGSGAFAETSDTSSAGGKVIVTSELSALENQDSVQVSGKVIITASGGLLEESDQFYSAAGAFAIGNTSLVEQSDTYQAFGKVLIAGSVFANEENDSIGSSYFEQPYVEVVYSEDDSWLGQVLIFGDSVLTEEPDTIQISGNVLVSGTLLTSEELDSLLATQSGSSLWYYNGLDFVYVPQYEIKYFDGMQWVNYNKNDFAYVRKNTQWIEVK